MVFHFAAAGVDAVRIPIFLKKGRFIISPDGILNTSSPRAVNISTLSRSNGEDKNMI